MNVAEVSRLTTPVPSQHALTGAPAAPFGPAASTPASPAGSANLSQQASQTYQVLRGGATFPPSASPAFVLPANSRGFMQLYATLQRIAVEHVYPAPIFSFSA